jgi:hypothetical protein
LACNGKLMQAHPDILARLDKAIEQLGADGSRRIPHIPQPQQTGRGTNPSSKALNAKEFSNSPNSPASTVNPGSNEPSRFPTLKASDGLGLDEISVQKSWGIGETRELARVLLQFLFPIRVGKAGEVGERIDPEHPPGDVPASRWRRFLADCYAFESSGLAEQARALGWNDTDLYGCDPDRPYARIDRAGLVWLLNGDRVVALTHDSAAIETSTGVRLMYRRKPNVRKSG